MFWKEKTLNEMSPDEWESLCDRCGKCCTLKLHDEISDDIYDTSMVCKLFNIKKCECNDYNNRMKYVKDCIKLSPSNINELEWLPETCAYKIISEGGELFDWHHLISGSYQSVHETKNSVITNNIVSEENVKDDDYEDYIIKKSLNYEKKYKKSLLVNCIISNVCSSSGSNSYRT